MTLAKKLLSGFRRMSQSRDSRFPITLPILINILNSLPHVYANTFEVKLFASAFSLVYFALLLVGEITQTNRSQNNALAIHNMILLPSNSIKLSLAKTKTDQNGAGTTFIITLSDDNHQLFNNLQSYLNARPKYLLCHIDGSPLTYYQFNQILKRALAFLSIIMDLISICWTDFFQICLEK